MAGNAPGSDLHILKIPLAFFGLHRGTADPQAVQRLENYIAKLKKELHRHALKAIEAPDYFLPEDFKQALSAMPSVVRWIKKNSAAMIEAAIGRIMHP